MPEQTKQQQRDRVRQRIRAAVDPENYEYTPEKHQTDHVRADEFQRVAIYARVSTNDPTQTSSFELQQKYYQDLVGRYPEWQLVKIYTDEGKSGVTIQHRTGFIEMMEDAFAGRIDLIIVKNISRLARNVVDFLSTIRKLSEKKVGVLFESEAIYSLNSNSHLALSFQATIAEEESRIRSRSMESSLRMRLDHGLPLTPELLGFLHDENGKLVINPETYKILKRMFYMYLYGYSTQQIAGILIRLTKRSYLGNIKWTASGVADTLKNEHYCGDVRTRKRFKLFAADVTSQKTFKNRGEKPQSYYKNEHDAIISRDDYLAVQRIMSNAKYGGTSLLPSLQVIPEGLLKGFVIVHPRWGSFRKDDYLQASRSVDPPEEDIKEDRVMAAQQGEFDLRRYEVADFKLFDDRQVPSVAFQMSDVRFNISCIRRMNCGNYVELLVHPVKKQIAVRPASADNRCAIHWADGTGQKPETRPVAAIAGKDPVLFDLLIRGEYKATYEKIMALSTRSQRNLQEERRRFQRESGHKSYMEKPGTEQIELVTVKPHVEELPIVVGIKEMPEFDPDMELRGLALTIPTWMNAMSRAWSKTDITLVSDLLKRQLAVTLGQFRQQIDQMTEVLTNDP